MRSKRLRDKKILAEQICDALDHKIIHKKIEKKEKPKAYIPKKQKIEQIKEPKKISINFYDLLNEAAKNYQPIIEKEPIKEENYKFNENNKINQFKNILNIKNDKYEINLKDTRDYNKMNYLQHNFKNFKFNKAFNDNHK